MTDGEPAPVTSSGLPVRQQKPDEITNAATGDKGASEQGLLHTRVTRLDGFGQGSKRS